MNDIDENAVRWAIETYWKEKSDFEIADGLHTTADVVKKMREEMGHQRESLKEFAQRYLLQLSEKEKREWMSTLSKDLVWKMAEGNPASSGELNIHTEPIKIDITHQLQKVYGPRIVDHVPADGETSELPAGPGE